MKKIAPIDSQFIMIAIILVGITICSLGANAIQFLQPKGRISCASFGSYGDIPSDWKTEAPWLDRNHDGIPCNALYHNFYKK